MLTAKEIESWQSLTVAGTDDVQEKHQGLSPTVFNRSRWKNTFIVIFLQFLHMYKQFYYMYLQYM